MTTDSVTYVMSSHDIAVHIGLAFGTVEPANLDLSDEFLAYGALFRGVVFIDSHNDVAQGPGLVI